jgi:DNA-binding CsgD family transcriptional regulator
MEQTLRSLLGGDSEKQCAAKLGVSHHTVHVYVKALYKKYGVSSRGELLAKCLKSPAASTIRTS